MVSNKISVCSGAYRSRSSHLTSFIDSDSYVVVGKEHVVGAESQTSGPDSRAGRRDSASSSGAGSRAAQGRELARDSSTGE